MKKIYKYIINILLFSISLLLIIYSSYRIIKVINNRNTLDNNIIEIDSTIVDKNNNDKLVFTNGYLILKDDIKDDEFNVSVRSSMLERIVEVYQYKETKEDDETYSYEMNWFSELIDSSNFKNSEYKNPSNIKYKSKTYYNDTYLGAFKLNNKEINELGCNSRYLDLNSEFASKNGFKISNQYYTTSEDIDLPEIGDIRISFKYNSSSSVSILALQNNNTFDDYKLNDMLIHKVYDEKLTKKDIIKDIYPLKIVLYIIIIVVSLLLCSILIIVNKKSIREK